MLMTTKATHPLSKRNITGSLKEVSAMNESHVWAAVVNGVQFAIGVVAVILSFL